MDILARLSAVEEEAVFGQGRRLTCFLSYRFTPASEALLFPLKEFLGLCREFLFARLFGYALPRHR
jgi:hypothetical protein